jgi:hypothetical protein
MNAAGGMSRVVLRVAQVARVGRVRLLSGSSFVVGTSWYQSRPVALPSHALAYFVLPKDAPSGVSNPSHAHTNPLSLLSPWQQTLASCVAMAVAWSLVTASWSMSQKRGELTLRRLQINGYDSGSLGVARVRASMAPSQ